MLDEIESFKDDYVVKNRLTLPAATKVTYWTGGCS